MAGHLPPRARQRTRLEFMCQPATAQTLSSVKFEISKTSSAKKLEMKAFASAQFLSTAKTEIDDQRISLAWISDSVNIVSFAETK